MELPRSEEFFGYGSVEVTETIECTAGVPVPVAVKWSTTAGNGFAAIRLGVRSPEPADLMDRAVAAAAAADIAVVVVGTNDEWETEGHDRTTMDLPGRQDELVRRVVAANPRTAVVVNAGSPVTMDWAADDDPSAARAVLTSFFAGQEQAEGLVDVLFGDADPGGRLPTTFPKRLADHPAYVHHRPDHDSTGAGTQRYGEGLFMGYRGYDACDVAPRFAFGHGLSYGSTDWGEATASATHDRRRRFPHRHRAGDRHGRARRHGRRAGLRRTGCAEREATPQGTQGMGQVGRRRGNHVGVGAGVRPRRLPPLGHRDRRLDRRARRVRHRDRIVGRCRARAHPHHRDDLIPPPPPPAMSSSATCARPDSSLGPTTALR